MYVSCGGRVDDGALSLTFTRLKGHFSNTICLDIDGYPLDRLQLCLKKPQKCGFFTEIMVVMLF